MSSAIAALAFYGLVRVCIDVWACYLSTKPVGVGNLDPVGEWRGNGFYVGGSRAALLWPDGVWEVYPPNPGEDWYFDGEDGTRDKVEAEARRAGWEFRMDEEVSDA